MSDPLEDFLRTNYNRITGPWESERLTYGQLVEEVRGNCRKLDGSLEAATALLMGVSVEEIRELGGIKEE